MATQDNPLGAFFRGFQGAQQRALQQAQQAEENALTKQLREIQLLNAQRQMQEALKTPEQRAQEALTAQLITQAVQGGGVMAAEPGLQGLDVAIAQALTPQSQTALEAGQITPQAAVASLPPVEFETPVPGTGGAFVESPVLARESQARDIERIRQETEAKTRSTPESQRELRFQDVGDAVVAFDPVTGKEVSRTPKTPGKELMKTARGLFEYDPLSPNEGKIIPGTEPITTPGVYSTDQQRAVTQLTDRFNRNEYVKKAQAAKGAIDIILEGLKQNNSAGDIAAINQFQSGMVDPEATVREGDVELMTRSTAALARFQNYVPRLIKGGVLPPEMRKEINDLATSIYKMRAKNANSVAVKQYKDIAPKFGILFEDIGQEFQEDPSTPPPASGSGSKLDSLRSKYLK